MFRWFSLDLECQKITSVRICSNLQYGLFYLKLVAERWREVKKCEVSATDHERRDILIILRVIFQTLLVFKSLSHTVSAVVCQKIHRKTILQISVMQKVIFSAGLGVERLQDIWKCYYLFDCRQLQGKVKLLINMFEHFTKFTAREREWEQHKASADDYFLTRYCELRPISGD